MPSPICVSSSSGKTNEERTIHLRPIRIFQLRLLYQLVHLGLAECRNGKKIVLEILYPCHWVGIMKYLPGLDELKDFVVGRIYVLLPFRHFAVYYVSVRGTIQSQHFGEKSVRPFDVVREVHTRHLLVNLFRLLMIHMFHFTPSDPKHLVKEQQVRFTRVTRIVQHAIYRIHKPHPRICCHLYSSQDRIINRGYKSDLEATVISASAP
ncbi:hypothetical protein EV361DRAFT_426953 [Lentinula raphanica]|nr:hypothetical protein EV361DRAFT_426953 [Lentinula raphanica]